MPEFETIEQELLATTKFKAREYNSRQDYLAAVARKTDVMTDEEFDSLSVDAAIWSNAAITSLRARKKLPEFVAKIHKDDKSGDYVWDDVEVVDTNGPVVKPPPAKTQADRGDTKRRPKGAPARKLDHPPVDPQLGIENFQVDKWGLVIGSKNAAAAAMFEQGCRMADVTESIGGTYYNLIDRLRKKGHSVEKSANGMIKLTFMEVTE
ncbi:MAG TPA: hypothetical protein VFR24_27795 [Candidatus Angelobacter sp.]|nr:hypothetical protein [Candidatus Angelobacter sp.]